MYSNKDKKALAKNLVDILDDEQITMATVPARDDRPELVVLKQELFQDIITENREMKKQLFYYGGVVMQAEVNSPQLGETIAVLHSIATDVAQRFLDPEFTKDMVKSMTGEAK